MDDKKKKKYVIPEAEIVDFADEDIITGSAEWWGQGNNDNQEWPWAH